jgi:hypothetical protein
VYFIGFENKRRGEIILVVIENWNYLFKLGAIPKISEVRTFGSR